MILTQVPPVDPLYTLSGITETDRDLLIQALRDARRWRYDDSSYQSKYTRLLAELEAKPEGVSL